jgi:hypothetical protein
VSRRKSSTSGKGSSHPSIDILKNINQISTGRALRVSTSVDLSRLSIASQLAPKPVQFGSPSSKGSSTTSSNKSAGSWASLLGNMATGGISDLLGGGAMSSGLDYFVTGIESLFGGSTTSPADSLTRFELPDAQTQTIYANQIQTSANVATRSGMYANAQSQVGQMSQAMIVQTIKNALLTSSGLNDVIGQL